MLNLITRFTCKLNIEKNGTALLNNKLQKVLFTISLHNAEHTIHFSIFPKEKSVKLPDGPFIPRRFTIKNITKISASALPQGKYTISLKNYNASMKGFQSCEVGTNITSIFISEAAPEALEHLTQILRGGPVKRPAQNNENEMPVQKQAKLSINMLDLPNELLRLIIDYSGESVGKFRSLSKRWKNQMSQMITHLRILKGKEISGDLVVRIVRRSLYCETLDLSNCVNLMPIHIKKANILPIKKVITLSLRNCKKLNSSAIFNILQMTPRIENLDLTGCSAADDELLRNLNPRIHLTNLKRIKLGGGGFTPYGMSFLGKRYPHLKGIELSDILLNKDLILFLQRFTELDSLIINFNDSEMIDSIPECIYPQLKKLNIFPQAKYPSPSDSVRSVIESFTGSEITELGTHLSPRILSELLRSSFKNLQSLLCCGVHFIPDSLTKLMVFSDGEDLLELSSSQTSRPMKNLSELRVIVREGYNCARQLQETLTFNYPKLIFNIIISKV